MTQPTIDTTIQELQNKVEQLELKIVQLEFAIETMLGDDLDDEINE